MNEKEKAVPTMATTPNDTTKIEYFTESIKKNSKNIQLIEKELHNDDDGVINDGVFIVRSANEWMEQAKNIPDPKPLWLSLWYEGEICCLFAESGAGKSIYAVLIAKEIALKQKVIYFDFELTDKQFQLRYTGKNGRLYHFPDNLYRVQMNNDFINEDDETEIIEQIEKIAIQIGAKVLIIDNLTWLCNDSEKGEQASIFMKKIMCLKMKYGFSTLVVAHTPKRKFGEPMTPNDLAGSRRLYNFFDSAFCIGFCQNGDNLRYIKQLKGRMESIEYGANNVIVSQIIKEEDCFTTLKIVGYDREDELIHHVKVSLSSERKINKVENDYRQIFKDNKPRTFTEIVKELEHMGVTKNTATARVKNADRKGYLIKQENGLYNLVKGNGNIG